MVARICAAVLRQLARLDDRYIVGTLAITLVMVGVRWGAKAAGGAGSYGYVSQAELWLSGRLTMPLPWLSRVPWPEAAWQFSPLGYRPGVAPFDIVPGYAPGLPMLMALAKLVGGQAAIFWVVPLSAGVLVLATLGVGRRLGGSRAGMLAAWLVATSPIVLYMLVQPMSDIPVAAAWAVAFWCVLGEGVAPAAGAGLAVAAAILIRPNLVPMAALPFAWLVASGWKTRRFLPAAVFAATAAPGVLVTAMLNMRWYGSPFLFGYESSDVLFGWANVWPNVKHSASWFVDTQTPFALLGLSALLLSGTGLWRPQVPRGPLVILAMFVAAVWAQSSAHAVFDTWSYLRFLLPCWPFVMLGVAIVLVRLARLSRPVLTLGAIAVALGIGLHGLALARRNQTFELQRSEDTYPSVARLVRPRTEPNSIVFSTQHAGSLRYYGGRMTLSFDRMAPELLDRAVQWFTEQGVHSYAVLEDGEVTEFKARFGERNVLGKLLMSPTLTYRGSSTVYLYDLLRPAGSADPVESVVELPTRPVLCLSPVLLAGPTFTQ